MEAIVSGWVLHLFFMKEVIKKKKRAAEGCHGIAAVNLKDLLLLAVGRPTSYREQTIMGSEHAGLSLL